MHKKGGLTGYTFSNALFWNNLGKMLKMPVYLDHNATTPLDPRALEAMLPYFTEQFGNPMSAQHAYGWAAKSAIEKAREQVAGLINAEPREIFFTSGATESVHLALIGHAKTLTQNSHFITSKVEHKCVLETAVALEAMGHTVSFLGVDSFGRVSADEVNNHLQPNTVMVSLMHANNEIGSVNPIDEIAKICKERGILLHVDAAQSLGKIAVDVKKTPIDLLSLSAHKFYGPKGAGALFVRQTSPRVRLQPILTGGGQEKSMRAGTHNVPAIVGMGVAAEIAHQDLATEPLRLAGLRDQLIFELKSALPNGRLNGHPTERLCNNVHFSVPGIQMDELLIELRGFAFSSSSACSSGAGTPSHVLASLPGGPCLEWSHLRFGLGRSTNSEVISQLIESIKKLAQGKGKSAHQLTALV